MLEKPLLNNLSIQQLKDIPITIIAQEYLNPYYQYWKGEGHFIAIDEERNCFYDHYQKYGNYGAINFVKFFFNYNFTEAIKFLEKYTIINWSNNFQNKINEKKIQS